MCAAIQHAAAWAYVCATHVKTVSEPLYSNHHDVLTYLIRLQGHPHVR
jgi:hypothetical protein